MTAITSIEQLTVEQISLINDFLTENKRNTFSKSYIDSLNSSEFVSEVKAFESFIYRGKFIPTPDFQKCLHGSTVRYAINLTSCTSSYTRTEALLLDAEFKPITICMTAPTCSMG